MTVRKIENKPNILEVLTNEGVRLNKRGHLFWGLCPFHQEKKASFGVYPDQERFVCWGCGARGDVIDFIMKKRGLSFGQAVQYLKVDAHRIDYKELKKRRAKEKFYFWRRDCYRKAADQYRRRVALTANLKSWEEVETRAAIFHEISFLNCVMEILTCGSLEEQIRLYRENRNLRIPLVRGPGRRDHADTHPESDP